MIANPEKPRRLFYLLWIVVTSLCFPITFFAGYGILRVIVLLVGDYVYVGGVRQLTENFLELFVFFPIAGLLTGIVQYWLLRLYLPRMGWWVAATAAGWLLGLFVTLTPGWLHWTSPFSSLDWAFLVLGVSIGVAQWLLLRRRLPRAGWWIAANVASWSLLALIVVGNSIGMLGLWTLGAAPAVATALMLALLMNQGHRAEVQGA